jgi:ankyrin repeat protein
MEVPEGRIIEAVKRGDIGQIRRWAMMQCLVKEFGADVNRTDYKGCTPFYFAVGAGDLAMVQYLVKKLYADVNQANT